jgi:hypothetical protein
MEIDNVLLQVIPVACDPIRALRGAGRGEALLERLLAARQEDRDREADQVEMEVLRDKNR